MYHVTKYSTIRGVFRGGSNGVCQGLLRLSRNLESGVDPGNEVGQFKCIQNNYKIKRDLPVS